MTRRLARWAAIAVLVIGGILYGGNELSRIESFQLIGEPVLRVETSQPLVALTLDDGPSRAHTDTVLDILAAADVRLTFFLVGDAMESYPEGTAAIVAAGHEIGNHSYSHRRMIFMWPGTVRRELERTDAAIAATGQAGQPVFRPPFGRKLISLPWVLEQQERPNIMWSIEAEAGPDGETATERAARVVEQAGPGDIILSHVMWSTNDVSRAALPQILKGLRDKGLTVVTVSELLAAEGR